MMYPIPMGLELIDRPIRLGTLPPERVWRRLAPTCALAHARAPPGTERLEIHGVFGIGWLHAARIVQIELFSKKVSHCGGDLCEFSLVYPAQLRLVDHIKSNT